MNTRIAVIGSTEFIERIESITSEIAEIDFEAYVYEKPTEAGMLVKTVKPCDAVLFSGALPYYFSKEYHEHLPIPAFYLAQDEMSVTSSLLTVLYHKKISPHRISVDVISASIVTNVLNDLQIEMDPSHIMDYQEMLDDSFDISMITSYHHELWKGGFVDLALTSIHSVYDQLQLIGVPAMRMIDPRSSIFKALQDIKTQTELIKSKSSQIAVCYVISEEENAHELVDGLAHEIQASVQLLEDSHFILYSTRGDIESLIKTNGLNHFFDKFKKKSKIGFGYGATLMDADRHAKIALGFAEKHSEYKCGYILTEDKDMLGPFPQQTKQQRLKNDHPELLQVAKQTKLSPANISKIIQFSLSRQSVQFTAAELEDYLQVTRRTTERILKKLSDHGHVSIVGEEMTYSKGRPRAVYELNLPVY
ncbi:transcriptional regulator [Peribacillus frigoritolerans]|uniref:transcriptional regulator n=1 Tax=Peribacillus frigoritolerans TaxID=450367 RepID=UPI002EAFC5FB|nr:transcriptional regulator [Peribacillus frigoritolerans]